MAQDVQPRRLLLIRRHHGPGRIVQMRALQHLVAGGGIGAPAGLGLGVQGRDLEPFQRVVDALLQAAGLFVAADVQPQLDQDDARLGQHPLEMRGVVQEALMLLGRAEAHDRLDSGPIVPGAVEDHDLARRRQMGGVALEIPLRRFALGRLGQGDDARLPRGHVFGHPLDRPVLAGGVAPLEDDDDLQPLFDGPGLGLDHLDLQGFQDVGVVVLGHGRVLVSRSTNLAANSLASPALPFRVQRKRSRK